MKKLLLLIGFASLTMNAQVPSYVPTNGLVAYYPFDGNANDISGNGYNGTNNGANLTTDRFGNPNSAYSFNGTSNYITLGSSFTSGSSPKSFSVWFYVNSATYSWILSGGAPLSNGQAFGLYYDESRYVGNLPHKLIFHGNGLNYDYGFGEIVFQSWNNVVITYDGKSVSSYLNGAFIGSSNKTLNTALNSLVRIGSRSNNTAYLNGKIDDIGIWNRALTPSEITTLYYSESCQSLIINTGVLSYNPPKYNNTITIYPNPAQDQITIDCGTLANVVGYHLEIVNTLGQVVFNQPMNTQQYKVALNTWSGEGIYFVKIYDASNNLLNTKKIILQ
ncbi:LamG-like jellyroll fold domain-containing protein [Flavobacterium myungsuense]|uniref:LamG-like jellyroll fold domain-containing protein n=1 Tax=Flavobacterium myungsuense TaxID=651823 RepID=A0ABW3J4W5_9FLAO